MSYDSLGGESFFHPPEKYYIDPIKKMSDHFFDRNLTKKDSLRIYKASFSMHKKWVIYSREVTLGLCNFIQNQWKNQSRILKFRCIMHMQFSLFVQVMNQNASAQCKIVQQI